MKARGPKPGSTTNNVHYPVAGAKNLFLVVYGNGVRSFLFDRTFLGQRYTLTLGKLGEIGFDDAIKTALDCHRLVDEGFDPKTHYAARLKLTFAQYVETIYRPYIRETFETHLNMENMLDKRLLAALGAIPLGQITKADVRRFLDKLAAEVKPKTGKKLSGATLNRYRAFLSGLFKYAMGLDLIATNPCAGIRRAKENPSRSRYLRDEEYRQLFRAMKPKMKRPSVRAIYLLLVLGLRRGEVIELAWADVNLQAGEVFIRDPKNGESRYVGLNSLALDLLKVMHAERDPKSPWVFPSKSKTGHLQDVKGMFKSLCQDAGIKGVVTHDCRRSHATHLHRLGVDALTIKEVLGHKSLQSTMVYIRMANREVTEANERAATRLREVVGE